MGMGPDELADLEGDAGAILRLAGLEDDVPPSMDRLCAALLGAAPIEVPRRAIRGEGCLARVGDQWRVYLASDITPDRARWIIGHELAHWWHRTHLRAHETEERCDTIGALIAVPRRAMLRAVKLEGHAVSRLAARLRAPQPLTLLRLGETTLRPVALIRPPVVARGAAFDWPEALTHRSKIEGAHPVQLGLGVWGWMAAA